MTLNKRRIAFESYLYRVVLLIFWGGLSSGLVWAQAPNERPGELLVQLDRAENLRPLLRQLRREGWQPVESRQLIAHPPVFWLAYNLPAPPAALAERLRGFSAVVAAQSNHRLELRRAQQTIPNDPQFSQQWALNNTGQTGGVPDADIDAPEAWDIATGGATTLGDTPVVAIVDEGAQLDHPDLNFWKNRKEIPANGLDDDQNGYVDDYDGWNAYRQDGDIPTARHGTHVTGIATARADNSTGIAGVFWGAKILPVAGSTTSEATVIEAYGYVIAQRRRYNATGGSEGAFIVATNSSFGVNGGDPVNFPIWCALYDSLGALGVINVVSTANRDVDVDVVKDIPSNCPSNFTIAVTNTNDRDRRQRGSAWGKRNIDLGAPGTNIVSTIPGSAYGNQTGTSMAAPHVTGAVALLFSTANERFQAFYDGNPGAYALALRRRLLTGVDTLAGLRDSVASGGRLNLFGALNRFLAYADSLPDCAPPYKLRAQALSDTSAVFSWQGDGPFLLRYRPQGTPLWRAISLSAKSTELSGLLACTPYEWEVARLCGVDTSEFSGRSTVLSLGCCEAPRFVGSQDITDSSLRVNFSPIFGAQAYNVRLTSARNGYDRNVQTTDTSVVFDGLQVCQPYTLGLQTACSDGMSSEVDTFAVSTGGCGVCTAINYCVSFSDDATEDWIQRVRLGPLESITGSNGGYGGFFRAGVTVPKGQLRLELEPGFRDPTSPFPEWWQVWIDLNRDGVFDQDVEKIYDSGAPITTSVDTFVRIPDTTRAGPTRMRVSMRFSQMPRPCQPHLFGEVEDYCIILERSANRRPDFAEFLRILPQPATDFVDITGLRVPAELFLFDLAGRQLGRWTATGRDAAVRIDLQPYSSGLYVLTIRSVGQAPASFRLLRR